MPALHTMSKTTTVILLLILIAAGGIILFGKKSVQAPTTNTNEESTSTQDQGATGGPSTTTPIIGGTESVGANGGITFNPKGPSTVEYTNSGFSPASLTVKVGDTVTFVNHSSNQMWVASNPHPIHTDLSGFDEKTAVGNGGSYSYTFTTAGTHNYHNHVHASDGGTIIVQ